MGCTAIFDSSRLLSIHADRGLTGTTNTHFWAQTTSPTTSPNLRLCRQAWPLVKATTTGHVGSCPQTGQSSGYEQIVCYSVQAVDPMGVKDEACEFGHHPGHDSSAGNSCQFVRRSKLSGLKKVVQPPCTTRRIPSGICLVRRQSSLKENFCEYMQRSLILETCSLLINQDIILGKNAG